MTNKHLKSLTIKQWNRDDRPREKMLLKGKSSLSDAELLAILIRSGSHDETAVELSKRILKKNNFNLNSLARLSVKDLSQFKGIGIVKAITIVTALELGKRRSLESTLNKPKINSSKVVFEIMNPIIGRLPHEEFWILYLNNANKIENKSRISKGGITATIVDVRLVYKRAIEYGATSIILCHNHPSGNRNPSNADDTITEKLKNGANLLDIQILDHIIIADVEYFSYADEGKL